MIARLGKPRSYPSAIFPSPGSRRPAPSDPVPNQTRPRPMAAMSHCIPLNPQWTDSNQPHAHHQSQTSHRVPGPSPRVIGQQPLTVVNVSETVIMRRRSSPGPRLRSATRPRTQPNATSPSWRCRKAPLLALNDRKASFMARPGAPAAPRVTAAPLWCTTCRRRPAPTHMSPRPMAAMSHCFPSNPQWTDSNWPHAHHQSQTSHQLPGPSPCVIGQQPLFGRQTPKTEILTTDPQRRLTDGA